MNIADELRKLQDLHRSGALTDAEFAAAKAAVLGKADADAGDKPALQEHLEEIKRQNEIAQLDREWGLERDRYMITGQNGFRYMPNRTASVFGGIVIAVFGMIWTGIAASMASGFGEFGGGPGGFAACFPAFGVLFILFGVGMSIYSYNKANQYEEAYRRYQRRRSQLLAGESEREDSGSAGHDEPTIRRSTDISIRED